MLSEAMQEIMTITDDIQADAVIEEMRDLEIEYNRMEMIAKAKIDSVNAELKKKKESMEKQLEFKRAQLRAYFLTTKPKETKTTKKYKLFNGELELRKASKTFVVDKDKLLEEVKESFGSNYVKTKEELDWAKFKKELEIKNDLIIHKSTGEIIELDGIAIAEKAEEFKVNL